MDAELIRAQSALEDEQWWFRGRARIICDLLPGGSERRSLLDVGCGWGGLTRHLAAHGAVVGVEPSPAAREEAGRRGLTVLEGTADRLPVPDASVDVAVATDVIEHLADDVAALRELARVLRDDGLALITVPACPWLFSSHDRALGHHRRYSRGSLLAAVRAAGLRPVRVTHFNTFLFPPSAAVRLLTRRRAARVDAQPTWGPLNWLLYRIFLSERRILRRRDLPFGLSLAVLARRAAGAAPRPAHAEARTPDLVPSARGGSA
jgi:SAM-dependent methyltransferase